MHESKTRPYPAQALSQMSAVTVDDMVDGALSTPTVLYGSKPEEAPKPEATP